MEITAKKTGGTPVKVQYNFPADLAGLTAKFGESVVYSKAMDSLVIDVQALVRRNLEERKDKAGKVISSPKNETEIQAIVAAWIPGAGAVRKTPVEKIGSLISQMTPEEKKALLAQLKASA